MNCESTGKIIKFLRKKQRLTQAELAKKLGVSDKTISKWETGRGFPDIGIFESLSQALKASAAELLNGNSVENENKSGNILKSRFYVCPVCGNIIYSIGKSVNFCCGSNLSAEEEKNDKNCSISRTILENEIYVSIEHEMSKENYISFIAYKTTDRCEIVKLYPEQAAEARFFNRGRGEVLAYSKIDGLIKIKT